MTLRGQQPAARPSVKGPAVQSPVRQSPAAQSLSVQSNDKFSLRPADPLNASAFDHFYDMDYDASIREFTQIHQRHPDNPDAINHLVTAVLFRELYRIGALSSGEYANDSFVGTRHQIADPHTCEQIKSL